MAIEFRCHQCDTLLRTGDDKAGKRAKCPNCGTLVQTPFPDGAEDDFDYEEYEADEPASADPFTRHFGGSSPSTAMRPGTDAPRRTHPGSRPQSSRTIDCVMCGESIPASSRVCEYCGEPVRHQNRGSAPRSSYHGRETSGMAVASLVLGILGLVLCWIPFAPIPFGLLATIFGGIGIKATGPDGDREGRGMAIAGLVMGIVALSIYLLVIMIALMAGNPGPRWP